MEVNKSHLLIHAFALMHLAAALGCRLIGVADDLILTLLSMLLVVLICMRKQTGIIFVAVSVISVNFIGYALGKLTALGIAFFLSSPYLIYPLSTFLCTEIIGWSWLAVSDWHVKRHNRSDRENKEVGIRWLLIAFVAILLVRMVIALSNHQINDTRSTLIELMLDYAFSCGVLVWIAEYAMKYHQKARISEMDANLAKYRYLKLKQQVNPHFLFNSLNILDCLIQENDSAKASSYTHKLAGIYRYMLGNEDKNTVSLKEELDFVSQYIDLLLVRWPEGLEFKIEIEEALMNRELIPCSIQMLIENAIKHNAVRPDNKLVIDIHTTAKSIVVSNNRCPRLSQPDSTGIGLANLRQQYKDMGDKSIIVKSSEHSYSVILPFL